MSEAGPPEKLDLCPAAAGSILLEKHTASGENTIMSTTRTGIVLRHIRGLAAADASARLADGQLLERFTARRDEAAFAALVRRHGSMVLGVCRRVLGNSHDAEDAFQATFLVLAARAASVGKAESLGGWLYQVAYNTALKARANAAARRRREQRPDDRSCPDPLSEVTGRELLGVLDEELRRLPERYRAPLVLCYLEGLTRDEAAGRLGYSESTLKRRLEEGRERLRKRLERRGLALSAALLTAGVSGAAVSSSLAAATAGAALLVVAGKRPAVSAGVARLLAQGAGAWKAAALLAAILVATVAGVLAFRAPAAPPATPPPGAVEPPKAPAPPAAPKEETTLTGLVLGADGKPVPGAPVVALAKPLGRTRSDVTVPPGATPAAVLAEGKTDDEGRFRLKAPRTSSAQYSDVYLVATAEKHAPAWRRLSPDAGPWEAELKLPPEQVIRGSMVDLQGQPAAGVKITPAYLGGMTDGQPDGFGTGALPSRAAPWPAAATTDEKGQFVIRGCNRDQGVTLTVNDERFAAQSFRAETPGKPRPEHRALGYDVGGFLNSQHTLADEKGQPEVLKLSLAPARVVEGRVVNGDTGKPAAKAWVSGAQSDADGRFLLRFAGRDAVTLEVYPAEGEPYLSIFHRAKWEKGAVKQEVTITLPRGVLVRGKVTEAGSGKPVAGAAVQYWPCDETGSDRPKNALTGWSHCELTKQDGTFRMVVSPGAGHLMVQGPTPDYVHEEIGEEVISRGRPGGSRLYPDAFVKLDVRAKEEPKEVSVTLRRGATVRGKLLAPDGKPVARALVLSRLHVTRDLSWHFAGEARDGVFEFHGLDPDKAVPVYFLDPEKRCGAAVELSGKQAGETVTVKLVPCGEATARYIDGKGKPLADYRAAPEIVITPGAWGGYEAIVAKGELTADAGSLTNLDRHNYWDRVKTDAKGRITFPALIPGATYRIERWEKDHWVPHKEFTVESGKTTDLGDVVIDKVE
jgi:RNA polymerase sigma factor (sigma-70 family)